MRITIRLEDQLFADLKQFSAQTSQTLTAVIENALREMLARKVRQTNSEPIQLITDGGHGLQAGVDLDNTAELLDLMNGVYAAHYH
jgi:hypothetical protein